MFLFISRLSASDLGILPILQQIPV